MGLQAKIPLPKAIFNGFLPVTVRILNSYQYFLLGGVQIPLYIFPRIGYRVLCHFLRRALRDYSSTALAAFRSDINEVIGGLDDVQVMLDDNNCVSAVGQSAQDLHQLMNIRKMQAGGRLIQNVDSLSGSAAAQFCGQLDSLCLTAGQLGRRLPQTNVRKSYIIQSRKKCISILMRPSPLQASQRPPFTLKLKRPLL